MLSSKDYVCVKAFLTLEWKQLGELGVQPCAVSTYKERRLVDCAAKEAERSDEIGVAGKHRGTEVECKLLIFTRAGHMLGACGRPLARVERGLCMCMQLRLSSAQPPAPSFHINLPPTLELEGNRIAS